ncbi:TPA: hypothetical protein HA251_04715 [Candidatus Woesearchaeota archaeon]|nr:hypothetical protein [Candidatus Woesearchaeota archaeon]
MAIPYREAAEQPTRRQAYLDELLRAHPRQAIDRIIYDRKHDAVREYIRKVLPGHDRKHDREIYRDVVLHDPKNNAHYMYAFVPGDIVGTKTPAIVVVNSRAFDRMREKTFQTVLFGHEHQHAHDFYAGIDLPDGTRIDKSNIQSLSDNVYDILLETRALRAEIREFITREGTISSMFKDAFSDLRNYTKKIELATPNSQLEKTVLDAQAAHIRRTLLRYRDYDRNPQKA